MRHCNSVFLAQDIWLIKDEQGKTDIKLYIANCPICGKLMVLYTYFDKEQNYQFEKYYYSEGARRILEENKNKILKNKTGNPLYGFRYGINKEVKRENQIVGIKQYACDFFGNKELVKVKRNKNEPH